VTAAFRGWATAVRWLVASMVCALAAHAAVHRSLVPDDGLHGYFGWYVPLVALASLGSLSAVVVGGLRPRSCAARLIRGCLPARSTARRGRTVACLAAGGLAFLIVQESMERSLGTGAFSLVTFDASVWPALSVVLVFSAVAVLAISRAAAVLSQRTATMRRLRLPMTRVLPRPSSNPDVARKPALLGLHAGLRAPPLVA
jgi:hypothetical protein